MCGHISRLSRFAGHRCQEVPEKIMAIVWAGGSFRVILHAEGGDFIVRETFDGFVVQTAMRHAQERRQRVFCHGEAVILRSDLDSARFEIVHGMVCAAMAELKLEGFCATSEAEELVAKANAENRLLAQQVAY